MIIGIIHSAMTIGNEEIEQSNFSIASIINGILARAGTIGREQSISYVPMMAQLLSDFSAETAFTLIAQCAESDMEVYRKCLYATQYLVAVSEGVQQRDAARFLVLNLFLNVMGGTELIRRTYREAILEVSAVATGPLANVDAILREELRRMHPRFLNSSPIKSRSV